MGNYEIKMCTIGTGTDIGNHETLYGHIIHGLVELETFFEFCESSLPAV